MEFLDPEEKRERTIRLFVGYGLVATIIIFSTFILSFVLQGFSLFDASADVRNGLLFVDSKPVSANVSINNKVEKRTDARFVLPEGSYDVALNEDGYRPWQKTVDVIGGSVTYHIYPRLFPLDIKKQITAQYQSTPKIWTESPSRRWIVASASPTDPIFSVADTSKPKDSPVQIIVPETVISKQDIATATFKVIEWANDNRRFLLHKKTADGASQYVVIDRERPEESFNVSTRLALGNDISIRLRDKKYNQYYVLDAATKLLRRANIESGIEPVIVADGVVSYAPYESNLILYATESGAQSGSYAVRILDGATNYLLQPIIASQTVLLDVAKYEGDWFYIVGSGAQDTTQIYVNPLQNSSNVDTNGALRSQLKLNLRAPRFAAFSDNARFIAVQNDSSFSVYDAELQTIYSFNSPVQLPIDGATWMDGHRFHVVSGGAEHVFEYDGANYQTLTEAIDGSRAFYDRDFVRIFTLVKQADSTVGLQVGNLTLTD